MRPDPNTFPESRWLPRFGVATLRKGRTLAALGRIQHLDWSEPEECVYAVINDSHRRQFEVEIELGRNGDGWIVDAIVCSCGKNTACAHAAAVLVSVSKGELAHTTSAAGRPLPPELKAWLGKIQLAAQTLPAAPSTPAAELSDRLLYLLHPEVANGMLSSDVWVQPGRCRRLRSGANGKPTDFNLLKSLRGASTSFVQPEDVEIARRLSRTTPDDRAFLVGKIPLNGPHAAETLQALVATGRCHWNDHNSPPLRLGPPRPATPQWQKTTAGKLVATFEVTPPAHQLLAFNPPWYIDSTESVCGPIETPFEPALAQIWLQGPVLDPLQAAAHVPALLDQFQPLSLPPPPTVPVRRPAPVKPVPTLHLVTETIPWWEAPWTFRHSGGEPRPILAAQLRFAYGDHQIAEGQSDSEIRTFDGQELTLLPRDLPAEHAAPDRLRALGLVRASKCYTLTSNPRLRTAWTLEDRSDEALVAFVDQLLPTLRAEGWQITRDPGFALEICTPSSWYFETEPEHEHAHNNWFGLELGVRVGDEKINLLPVLLEGLQRNLECLKPESLRKRTSKEPVLIQLPDGRRIPFPAGRLRDILSTLLELHSPEALEQSGRLRVHRLRAAQLGELADAPNWTWTGAASLQGLAERLRTLGEQPAPSTPPDFHATLRPYQSEGLRWLQFIREFNLGGVLADDMGLGKTIQTLAHLALEKASGRLDRPALVVSPTSVLVNWRDEITRFAPNLRVLALHGSTRHSRFNEIQSTDVVLTTYALLPRDAKELLEAEFHCIILDEAQNIKNPRTQAAQVVCQLQARHRLCLSGTPLENHLGELWSLFNFLLPGFLSDETRFRAVYRQPIEKENNVARRKDLSRRLRPFLLRRRKDEVARELPEKTEIVLKVELAGSQRDLYETIRLAMESRVRNEVAKKGVNRSHIIILDALLKLRQVCCDPRLVPLEAARAVAESAKLDHLMELLPTLIEDGRRILLFSQFTSMLALIEQRLAAAKIPWLILTGDTTDRSTPVRQFQAREVPLFLLSLKAGGSGLNLTAADTVILFDPWWNPAVEAQATDRAHRIGQDKAVFVYRLIAAGTVEEKMVELQTRKRQLVQSLLEEGTSGPLQLQKEDIDLLFAPIG